MFNYSENDFVFLSITVRQELCRARNMDAQVGVLRKRNNLKEKVRSETDFIELCELQTLIFVCTVQYFIDQIFIFESQKDPVIQCDLETSTPYLQKADNRAWLLVCSVCVLPWSALGCSFSLSFLQKPRAGFFRNQFCCKEK